MNFLFNFFPDLKDRKGFNFKHSQDVRKNICPISFLCIQESKTNAKVLECLNPIIKREKFLTRSTSSFLAQPSPGLFSRLSPRNLPAVFWSHYWIYEFLRLPCPVLPPELYTLFPQFEIPFLFCFTSHLTLTVPFSNVIIYLISLNM